MEQNEGIQRLKQLISSSRNIAFFGGAGVSTASGIPDFRSATGLYNMETGSQYAPETILSHDFFITHPKEFYEFHLRFLVMPNAQPNAAHLALVTLEKQGRLKAIITQNIDGLHQAAGSSNVIELHGNAFDYFCMRCKKHFDLDFVARGHGVPRCAHCGGIVRPNVVLYGENLDEGVLQDAVAVLAAADLLIIGGTSLLVYPAASLVTYYRGKDLVLINREVTPQDRSATLLLRGDIAEILPAALPEN